MIQLREPVGDYSFPIGPNAVERKVWKGAGHCECGLPLVNSGGELAHHATLGEVMLQFPHEPGRAAEEEPE